MGQGMLGCVAYDLTRLFTGPVHMTPRGIDRVELGYARYFLNEWRGRCVATLPTPLGVRVVCREEAARIVSDVERRWGEMDDPDSDVLLERVGQRVRAQSSAGRPLVRRSAVKQKLSALPRLLRNAAALTGPLAADAVPEDAIFLSTGQVGIAVPSFLSWLKRRPDIRPVFMLHDLIPLEFTNFVPQRSQFFHRAMVDSVAEYAAALITTTHSAGAAIRAELRRRGRSDISVISEALPVAPTFARGPCPDHRLNATPYFVMVGSIEPRKNHALLLDVWERLAKRGPVPKLVIAGTRWRGFEAAVRRIERSQVLRENVIEVGGLSTPSLRRLISNARGLLMPSFAEGFGLPVIEAQALGVPVIASDIPAHREAGGVGAIFLATSDGHGWVDAVHRLASRPVDDRAVVLPRSWTEYLARIEPFLANVAPRTTLQAVSLAAVERSAA